jgi:hypothetical protein
MVPGVNFSYFKANLGAVDVLHPVLAFVFLRSEAVGLQMGVGEGFEVFFAGFTSDHGLGEIPGR